MLEYSQSSVFIPCAIIGKVMDSNMAFDTPEKHSIQRGADSECHLLDSQSDSSDNCFGNGPHVNGIVVPLVDENHNKIVNYDPHVGSFFLVDTWIIKVLRWSPKASSKASVASVNYKRKMKGTLLHKMIASCIKEHLGRRVRTTRFVDKDRNPIGNNTISINLKDNTFDILRNADSKATYAIKYTEDALRTFINVAEECFAEDQFSAIDKNDADNTSDSENEDVSHDAVSPCQPTKCTDALIVNNSIRQALSERDVEALNAFQISWQPSKFRFISHGPNNAKTILLLKLSRKAKKKSKTRPRAMAKKVKKFVSKACDAILTRLRNHEEFPTELDPCSSATEAESENS